MVIESKNNKRKAICKSDDGIIIFDLDTINQISYSDYADTVAIYINGSDFIAFNNNRQHDIIYYIIIGQHELELDFNNKSYRENNLLSLKINGVVEQIKTVDFYKKINEIFYSYLK